MVEIVEATDMPALRTLFEEYAASIGVDLCFQGFAEELAGLPGAYAAPTGGAWIARVDGTDAGCIAVRRIDEATCEMKRLYVRPSFRGRDLGRSLAVQSIEAARSLRYTRMRLDTLATMTPAIELYRSLGFVEIAPYTFNPLPGARYFELPLQRQTRVVP